ncbi:four helix bundle protein [Leptolyngbya sp. 7M]|uniref:four helix bundle protein n=1 Tax=Leptolyngbya sp. 7M TaxID=2812896 RepID=UPI001B8D798E|nr:four helix bundle protein [Leptolyngbya sp. 7M]QYO62180.1 four helix bundle protein [Leptolyngbya sp. 7M]
MDETLIQTKSFEFALSMVRLYKKLQARQEFILSSQLLRSGTGIGVNVEEAANHDRKHHNQDFTQAMMMAAKEARETRYWLKLLQESHLVDVDVSNELNQLTELMELLNSVVE